jgi:trigger factor
MGKEVLYEEALDILLPQAYGDAAKEHAVEPIGKPDMDVVQFEKGKPLIFKVTVEVMPDVKLGEYRGVEAEMPEVNVGDDEVEAQLTMLQQRHARLVDAGDDPAGDGDIAVVDYEGTVDGKPEPSLSGKERSLEIGAHKLIPGFDAHLLGAKAGQELEFTLQVPAVFPVTELEEKEANFKMQVKGVKHKELSAIDDEFARDVSDCSTLDELKLQIKNNMEEVGQHNARRIFTEMVIKKVVAQTDVEPPASLVGEQMNVEYNEFVRTLATQNLDMDTYLHLVKREPEDLNQDIQNRARDVVKGRLVFDAIAKAEGMQVTPEELDEEIRDAAARYGTEDTKLRKVLDDTGQMRAFEHGLLLEKVHKFLADNAKPVLPQPVDDIETGAITELTEIPEQAALSVDAAGSATIAENE